MAGLPFSPAEYEIIAFFLLQSEKGFLGEGTVGIWFQKPKLEEINVRGQGTMVEHLGIIFTHLSEDSLTATMPVDHRTKQPIGLLHGGASVVLAETIGSTAANLCVDPHKEYCVGIEINANHVRSAREGRVTGVASPMHLGKTTQVWEIKMTDEEKKLVSLARLTMAVLTKRKSAGER